MKINLKKLNEFNKHISKCSKLSLQTLNASTIVTLPQVSKKGYKPVMKFENYNNKIMIFSCKIIIT